MVEGVDLPVDGVGLDIERDNLERVGMHVEGVALGVVDGHGTVGAEGEARMLIVLTVVARQFVLIHGVDVDHIAEGLAEALLTVVEDTIAHHRLPPVGEDGTVHQPCLIALRVVVAQFGVDMALAGGDVGGADDMGQGGAGVIVQGVGGQEELRAAHLHVVVEDRHLALCVVLAPVGGEGGVAVDHLAALKEVDIVVEAVEVEAVGVEGGLAMLQHHVMTGTRHLLVALVEGIVAEQREGVALIHLHMAEGLEGVAGLVEIGTVAVESRALVGEVHLAVEDGGVAVLQLVVVEQVGMDEVDTVVLDAGLAGWALALLLGIGG